VATSGKYKYNLRLTFRLPFSDRLFFKFLAFLLPFLYTLCKLNTVMNTNSAVLLK